MNDPIVRLLSRPGTLPADLPTLLRKLGWADSRRSELQSALHTEEREGRLVRIKGDRYVKPEEAGLVTGRLRVNRSGRGWLLADDPSTPEISVAEAATGTAFNEDRVLVRKDPGVQTGAVVRVLERRRTRFVGTLHRGKGVLRVVPDDPRIPHEFYVPEPKGSLKKARPGDKVVVELKEWESRRANPEGEVVEVLGAPEAEGVDMLSVLRQYNLEKEFPKVVIDAARAHGDRVRERDLAGRVDCRAHRVVTIDPDDAKDFDDAICVERGAGGSWRVWVHVADVAFYVKPGTPLDHEALERGNSTYLVDRVIPMLPEGLSNELCSLKPGVDRLTQCVEFELAPEGRVKQAKFYRAVIHSKRRYTYGEALAVLAQPARDEFDDMIQDAGLLAQRLRRARFEAGALELGSSEIKIRLDARGHVLRLEKHLNDESHQLIEEFMLLANEAVAVRLGQMNRMALHRVHEEPDPKRLNEYRDEVRALGIECGDLKNRAEMRRLTDRIAKHPAGHALRVGLLRSLQRARYDVVPGGHFGLAKKHYTHFTSPIRRYADLIVHRALSEGSVGTAAELNRLARHISDTERNSSDAERDSRDIKLFHYLDGQLRHGRRHVYSAVITGVQSNGFLVDAPDLSIGGLVPVSSLDDDFYVLDPVRRCWVGRRRRRMYRVGDTVNVRVRKVDMAAKRLDFELAPSARPGIAATPRPHVSAGTAKPAPVPLGGRRKAPPAPVAPVRPVPVGRGDRPVPATPRTTKPIQASGRLTRPVPTPRTPPTQRPAPSRPQQAATRPSPRPTSRPAVVPAPAPARGGFSKPVPKVPASTRPVLRSAVNPPVAASTTPVRRPLPASGANPRPAARSPGRPAGPGRSAPERRAPLPASTRPVIPSSTRTSVREDDSSMFPKDLPPLPPVNPPGKLGQRGGRRDQPVRPAKPVAPAPAPAPLKPLMSSSVRRPQPPRPAEDSSRSGGSRDRRRR